MSEQVESPALVTCTLNNKTGEYSCTPPDAEMGILLELGSMGAGHAATSLSDVLQQQVVIDVPKLHKIAPNMLPKFYDRHDTPTTAVYMQLDNSECDILLMFDYMEAKKIAAMMTMAPSVEELEPAMEESAIQELANILIGSFLSAISDFTGVRLQPTTPQRIVDIFDTILDNFLVKQSMVANEALIFDTNFKRSGEAANSILMLFPSPQLQALLVQKSRELMGV
jgi:chemotaxis protein CheC